MTSEQLAEIEARAAACFRGPWTAETWTVECPLDDDECEVDEHDVETILAPDEYPSEQVVAQVDDRGRIHTPGLEGFAAAHARFIAGARTDVPDLVARVRELEAEVSDLRASMSVAIQEQRAAAAAKARDKALEDAAGDLSFWHAQLNADWNESPTEYKDGLRDGCEFAEKRIRALRGGVK